MKKLLEFLVLPKQVSAFEAQYLKRMNRVGLAFFALHVPVFAVVAHFNETSALLAIALTLAVMTGPALAYLTFRNPRGVSMVYGFTAMLMGGLLVHFGQGPVQIEMHFYFFALIAMLAVFGNPLAVLVAAVTVALHHLILWIVLPASVFNYAAPVWVVAVHAAFVVLESVATCFIARSFFDNVIGLEKIVQERTAELDDRNRDLRLVLDNVEQGFLTIDRDGVMSKERSAIVTRWLGPAEECRTFAEYLEQRAPEAGGMFRLAFEEVLADVLPLELTLDQMPKRFSLGRQHFRLSYTPIMVAEKLEKLLLVISDITADVERERLEVEQREVVYMFERVTRDRNGFLEFFAEAEEQMAAIESDECRDPVVLKRIIHTLKGNAMMFGINTVADICHAMETQLVEEHLRPQASDRAALRAAWDRLRGNLDTLLGERQNKKIEIDDSEYDALLHAVLKNEPRPKIARMIADWKLEPTAKRLARVAEHANGIARRLNKGVLRVSVADHNLRLDPARWAPFWSAFVHVVRNAIDHGLEYPEERSGAGKPQQGTLELTTRLDRNDFVIEIADDGRGVNWDAIADNAKKNGLPHGTPAELLEALFEDGITTSTQVSEFSGRGIGMGAVRSACQARGGVVCLVSREGGGTRVEFRFAREQMVADPLPKSLVA
jgi:two-component system chemotaxis sensor kinase CheA